MQTLNKKKSKIVSEQSGPFNTGPQNSVGANRNIDIVIPQSMGVISLKDTFIQLRLSIIPDDPTDFPLLPYFVENKSSRTCPVYNSDLIRNCWMSCTNYGRLEDIRRVNVLRKNVREFEQGVSAKFSQGQSLYNLVDPSTWRYKSPFIEVHVDDGFSSKQVDAHIRIDLSDLYELGSVELLDLSKLGDLRVHIELEQKSFFDVNYYATSAVLSYVNEDLEDTPAFIVGIQNANSFDLPKEYTEKSQIPFYVGMPIVLSYEYWTAEDLPTEPSDGSGNFIITQVIVTQTINTEDNTMSSLGVQLVFDPPLPDSIDSEGNTGNYNIEEISIQLPEEDPSFSVLTCEMVVCHYLNVDYKMDALEWTTYTTEEYTNGQNDLNKIFELEPECTAVLVMFANDDGLLSNYKDHFSYRMRVDNVDAYEYDIECNKLAEVNGTIDNNEPLYYDALKKLFTQTGRSLKCVVPCLDSSSQTNLVGYTNVPDNKRLILGTPTQLTPLIKLFQLNIKNEMAEPTVNSPINNIVLFKQVQKVLKL